MNRQSRWRSPVAFTALVSLILFVLKQYFNYEIPQGDRLIELILVTLTALGVFNNPTDKNNY